MKYFKSNRPNIEKRWLHNLLKSLTAPCSGRQLNVSATQNNVGMKNACWNLSTSYHKQFVTKLMHSLEITHTTILYLSNGNIFFLLLAQVIILSTVLA